MLPKCIRKSRVSGFTIKRNNTSRISNIDDTCRSITGVVGVSALQHSAEGLGSLKSGFSENCRESKVEEEREIESAKRIHRA